MDREIKNAVITGTKLTNEDHGILSAWVYLDYGGSGQGFGGYNLYTPRRFDEQKNWCGHFVWRVLAVAGVGEWSKLTGKTVRADCDHSQVYGVGHIVNDDWFYPSKDFAEKGKINESTTSK